MCLHGRHPPCRLQTIGSYLLLYGLLFVHTLHAALQWIRALCHMTSPTNNCRRATTSPSHPCCLAKQPEHPSNRDPDNLVSTPPPPPLTAKPATPPSPTEALHSHATPRCRALPPLTTPPHHRLTFLQLLCMHVHCLCLACTSGLQGQFASTHTSVMGARFWPRLTQQMPPSAQQQLLQLL